MSQLTKQSGACTIQTSQVGAYFEYLKISYFEYLKISYFEYLKIWQHVVNFFTSWCLTQHNFAENISALMGENRYCFRNERKKIMTGLDIRSGLHLSSDSQIFVTYRNYAHLL